MDWLTFVVSVLFNIGAVTAIRLRLYKVGSQWLRTSRVALVLVFLVALLESWLTGGLEAFRDPDMMVESIRKALDIAATAVAVHSVGKTLREMM